MQPSGNPTDVVVSELNSLITGRDVHAHEKRVPALVELANVKRRARESTASRVLFDALVTELNDVFEAKFEGRDLEAVRVLFGLTAVPRETAYERRKKAADVLQLGVQGAGVDGRTYKDRYQKRLVTPTAHALLERHREASAQSATVTEPAPIAAVDAEKSDLYPEPRGEETTAEQGVPSSGPATSSPERGRRARLLILVVAAVIPILSILGAILGIRFGDREEASDEPPPPTTVTARVLVAVDRSASMGCPLDLDGERCNRALRDRESRLPLDDRRLTRIGAAREWASRGINALKPGDQVAISAFWTSRGKGLRRVVVKRKAKPVLKRFVKLGPISGLPNLEELFGGLGVTAGGTPLNDMIAQGASDLRAVQMEDPINTLVILTDGGTNGSTKSLQELRTSLVAAAQAGEPPVRVLITAAGNATCRKLRAALAEPGDGDCFRAPNEKAVTCASSKIRVLLRTSQPSTPRSAKQKAEDRSCKK